MKVQVAGALALGIGAASAGPAYAQVSGVEAAQDVLRNSGVDPSRFVLSERVLKQGDGWDVVFVDATDAGGGPGKMGAMIVRNTGDTPTCFRLKWRADGGATVLAATNFNFVVEPYATQSAVLLQQTGGAGGVGVAVRTWPARTDVSQQRCSSVQPADLDEWLAS